jgi:hypothetical protein
LIGDKAGEARSAGSLTWYYYAVITPTSAIKIPPKIKIKVEFMLRE